MNERSSHRVLFQNLLMASHFPLLVRLNLKPKIEAKTCVAPQHLLAGLMQSGLVFSLKTHFVKTLKFKHVKIIQGPASRGGFCSGPIKAFQKAEACRADIIQGQALVNKSRLNQPKSQNKLAAPRITNYITLIAPAMKGSVLIFLAPQDALSRLAV